MKKTITCFCESEFEAELPDRVDCKKHPETVDSIIDGSFLNIRCPECGKVLKPEVPFLLEHVGGDFSVYFIPELDRVAYFLGNLEYTIGAPARVVIGYPELVEKLLIMKAGLDDRVIEAIKFYLLQKATDTSKDEDRDIAISFREQKPGALVFHIEGMKEDTIGVSEIKQEMYDKIKTDIDGKVKEEPFNTFLVPPYVSLNRVYMEK
ncbi:MAG: CpXC domain-containing protein [Spirochaetales bacterium]|nr:CpXC domain-containing protein [Spirochaetales bacterium]